MVRPPTREAEDTRRLSREREALLAERIRHANRIKGLLATQGVFNFEPTLRDRRARLGELRTPDGAPLPPRLRTEILRQVDRLELTMQQLRAVETERDAVFASERASATSVTSDADSKASVGEDTPGAKLPCQEAAGACLLRLKGIGPETASVLAGEIFFRDFHNRREVASYAGLAPSPWQSGGIDNEQGISKAGNARVRKTMGATRLAVVTQSA
jgi:transposase